VKFVSLKLRELVANNVVVSVIGDYSPLPEDARAALERTIGDTSGCTGMKFIIALNYGSRADILNAVKRLASGAVSHLTEADFASSLSTAGIPDPDLIIRTGGEKRLSNFLLWEAAYSELVFTDVLWPDFTPGEFDRCMREYGGRVRRFGGR
jgi:undecaprenyl diphosphate synthase